MRRIVAAFILAVALAVPSSVSAECAWVLWRRDTELTVQGKATPSFPSGEQSFVEHFWDIERAVRTESECAAISRQRVSTDLASTKKNPRYFEVTSVLSLTLVYNVGSCARWPRCSRSR